MKAVNKNWTDENGNHNGGQSIGDNFTIVWQRGPLNESGRNGAFLIEVLDACLEWQRNPHPFRVVSGIGFTIDFQYSYSSLEDCLRILLQVLEACLSQVRYYQSQIRFACEENEQAETFLVACVGSMLNAKNLEAEWAFGIRPNSPTLQKLVLENLTSTIDVLKSRRNRRADAGTLGTHLPDSNLAMKDESAPCTT